MLDERLKEIRRNLDLGLAMIQEGKDQVAAETLLLTAAGQVERLCEVVDIE